MGTAENLVFAGRKCVGDQIIIIIIIIIIVITITS